MKLDFFSAASRPPDEAERQAEVARYPAAAFADPEVAAIVAQAQALCGVPVAALSIIDGDRQRLFVPIGTALTETPRATALCAHTILAPEEVTVFPDMSADRRFAHNPLVAEGGPIRFYAAAPVRAASGACLGALCTMDCRPRDTLSPEQSAALSALATQIGTVLARHRTAD